MKKIKSAAIRSQEGKVATGLHHKDIEAKGAKGTRGFVTTSGDFVDRSTAAKIASTAKQVPKGIHSLRSEQLTDYAEKKKATGSI